MADLATFRAQHPEYASVSDARLAVALHQKFYSSVPMVDYLGKVGVDRRAALDELYVKGNDPLGKYLIQSLETAGSTETPDQAAARYGGKIETRSPGTAEGAGRSFVQGGMFGWGDEFVGTGAAALDKLTGRTPGNPSFGELQDAYTSRERGNLDTFRKENPVVAYGSEIVGALPTAAAGGGSLAASGTSLATRVGMGGLVGAGQGAVYGAGSADGNMQERATGAGVGAVTGGALGAAFPWIGNQVSQMLSRRAQGSVTSAAARAAPSAKELKNAASQMFEAATGGKPLQITDTAYFSFLSNVKAVADKFRINPRNDPQATGLLDTLQKVLEDSAQGTPVDIKDLHLLRQLAQSVAKSADGRDGTFGRLVVGQMDDFISSLKPADIAGGGDPTAAANSLLKGISVWSRASKTATIEEAIRKGTEAASGPGNGIRNALRSLIKDESFFNTLNAAEQQALQDAVRGTTTSQLLRAIGILGFGKGSQLGGWLGSIMGNVAAPGVGMVVAPAIGTAARFASDKRTEGLASRALGAVASDSVAVLPQIDMTSPTMLEDLLRRFALPVSQQP